MNPAIKNTFSALDTKRLLLRKLTEKDDRAVFKIRSSDIVNKHIARPNQKSIEEAQVHIVKTNNGIANGKHLYWGITLKESQELIGTICFWNFSKDKLIAELGYELHPDYHRKGIMCEAVKRIIAYGFDSLKLESIEAFTDKANWNSIKLLQRHNFKCDVNRKDKGFPNNIIYILSNNNNLQLNYKQNKL